MSTELNNARVLEKLEIERRYWAVHGVDWKVVTEKEISYHKARNIEWFYSAQSLDPETLNTLNGAKALMLELYRHHMVSVAEMAQTVEEVYSLERGVGLLLFKHLVLNGKIHVDIERPLHMNMREVLVAA